MEYNVDINLYKKFYSVAKSGSFSKAARDMYCSQPALSKAIKQLENQLNTKLFYRNTKGLKLTSSGKRLFDYVDKSLKLLYVGERQVVEYNNLLSGEISIGIQSHLAQFYLFPYIKKFKGKYPGIKVNIRSRNTSGLLEQLQDNMVDFVIDTSPIKSIYNNLHIEELLELKNCFISYKKENINKLKDLENKKVILPAKATTPRVQLNEFLEKNDVWLNPTMTIETTGVLKNAVKEKMGIGYILESAVKKDIEKGELFRVNIEQELPALKLNLIYIENYLTKLPKLFIDMIRDEYNKND